MLARNVGERLEMAGAGIEGEDFSTPKNAGKFFEKRRGVPTIWCGKTSEIWELLRNGGV